VRVMRLTPSRLDYLRIMFLTFSSKVHEMVRTLTRSQPVVTHNVDEPDALENSPPPKQPRLERGYDKYRAAVELPAHADEVDRYVAMAPGDVALEDLLKWWQSQVW